MFYIYFSLQIVKPIILLYTTFVSMKMQARMQYYNEWSDLIPKKVTLLWLGVKHFKYSTMNGQWSEDRDILFILTQISRDAMPIDFGGSAYDLDDAIAVWKGECKPYLCNMLSR